MAAKKFGSQLATPTAAGFGKEFGITPLHGNMHDDGLKLEKGSRLTRILTSRTSEPFDLDGQTTTTSLPVEAVEFVETGVNWFSAFWRFTRPHTIIGSVSSDP